MKNTAETLRFGLSGGSFRTEIFDSDRLVLEGSEGVLDLSAERIGFRCGRRQVWVRGAGLRVVRAEENCTVLSGRIEAVEFE